MALSLPPNPNQTIGETLCLACQSVLARAVALHRFGGCEGIWAVVTARLAFVAAVPFLINWW